VFTVGIVDDQPVRRAGMQLLIQGDADLRAGNATYVAWSSGDRILC